MSDGGDKNQAISSPESEAKGRPAVRSIAGLGEMTLALSTLLYKYAYTYDIKTLNRAINFGWRLKRIGAIERINGPKGAFKEFPKMELINLSFFRRFAPKTSPKRFGKTPIIIYGWSLNPSGNKTPTLIHWFNKIALMLRKFNVSKFCKFC